MQSVHATYVAYQAQNNLQSGNHIARFKNEKKIQIEVETEPVPLCINYMRVSANFGKF